MNRYGPVYAPVCSWPSTVSLPSFCRFFSSQSPPSPSPIITKYHILVSPGPLFNSNINRPALLRVYLSPAFAGPTYSKSKCSAHRSIVSADKVVIVVSNYSFTLYLYLPMAALRETEPPPCLLLHNTYSMPSILCQRNI
jgi:hypothetical protein